MKPQLWQRIVSMMCCLVFASCTTSRIVTESREEVIPEATATRIRPIMKVIQYPQDDPRLILQLSKQLEGPITLQERKYEVIHPVWGNSVGNVLLGWFFFPLSPLVLIERTLAGKPGVGMDTVSEAFLGATGFNAPKGMFHKPDRKGEVKTESTPMGSGVREVPWPRGEVEVTGGDLAPLRLITDDAGRAVLDLKRIPAHLTNGSKDLTITISSQAGGVIAQERVTVPVYTMIAWGPKEIERARLEKENQSRTAIKQVCSADAERESQYVLERLGKGIEDFKEGANRCDVKYKECKQQCVTDYYEPAQEARSANRSDPEWGRLYRQWGDCNKACGQTLSCCGEINRQRTSVK